MVTINRPTFHQLIAKADALRRQADRLADDFARLKHSLAKTAAATESLSVTPDRGHDRPRQHPA